MTAPSIGATATARPRLRTAVTWLLRIALAAAFLPAGFSKLAGDQVMVDMFAVIGAGQWLRHVVGACEVAGAIGVLVPRVSALAAACLALLMLGATIANVTVLGSSPVVTIALLLVAALTAWLGHRRAVAQQDRHPRRTRHSG
jgi:putative oxidoreductase